MSQEQFVTALRTIVSVSATPGKNDKIDLLKKGDSAYLRKLLFWTYNRFMTYRVKDIEYPKLYNSVTPDIMVSMEELIFSLAAHSMGTNEAKRNIKNLLAMVTEEDAKVLAQVILRDLRCGIDEKLINKAFPKLIPVFDVMLADKVEGFDFKYPVAAEIKYDGVRTIGVYDGENVKFFSREGREFDECGVVAAEIKKLAPYPCVFDGEFLATTFNPNSKTCKKLGPEGNWPFTYGLGLLKTDDKTAEEVRNHMTYFVWDVIDYEYFTTGGASGRNETWEKRHVQLTSLFTRNEQAEYVNIAMAPNWICHTPQQIKELFRECRDKGLEGIMIKTLDSPYEFKRSKKLLKLKEFFTMDLRCYGREPGTGKYEGMVGALLVKSDCGKIQTKVGSGFTDMDRSELEVEFLTGRLFGKIVEVSGQEVTKDGSIRFPTFVRMRPDKTTTNTEGLV